MRLRLWLTRSLAAARSTLSRLLTRAKPAARALAGYRPNPRAWLFVASCWLVFSGLRSWSPPAAKIAVGLILLLACLRNESSIPTAKPPGP